MNDNQKTDPLVGEAIDWLFRMQTESQDAGALEQLKAWLAQSDAHRLAWETAQHTWQLMGEVPPQFEQLWRADAGEAAVVAFPSVRRRQKFAGWGTGLAAAAAVVAAVVFGPALLLHVQADYVTASGENRVVTLYDGSVVTLSGRSAIAIDLVEDVRRVALLQGEAFFEVTPDKSRPFVVSAGEVDVTVHGTAFDVHLAQDSTRVALEHGSVSVSNTRTQEQAMLEPGEQAVVDKSDADIVTSAVTPDEIGSWRGGQLFVRDATIASVIEQLQRYDGTWIAVVDGSLGAERVTGLYDLSNPERALRALVQPYGGQVHDVPGLARVISRF